MRGTGKQPGTLRRSQNWIGGTRPGNAVFVPPPAERVAGLLAAVCLASNYSTLVSAFQNDAVSVDDPVSEIVDIAS